MKTRSGPPRANPSSTSARLIVLLATSVLVVSLVVMGDAGNLTTKTVVATTNNTQHPVVQDYQGGGFNSESLTASISGMDYVYSVAWNGSYWLIGGYGTKTLIKYDGTSTYTDLTANIAGMDCVRSIAWNGSYWLFGGDGYSKTLIKYDGASAYTDLTSNISGVNSVYCLAWNGNGSYWLFGGSGTKRLIKFDGVSTYTDLTSNVSGMSFVRSLAWNGSYWLIGGDALIKFDGVSTYTDLTASISGMSDVRSIAWNGSCWLIGGYGYSKTLIKFDGVSTYTDLTSNISGMYQVTSLAWNGNGSYWLIGGDGYGGGAGGTKALIKYDGVSTYTDLTPNISGLGDVYSVAWNGSYWLIGGSKRLGEMLYKLTEIGAPTVSFITPPSGTSGTTVSITNLAGTGFYGTPTVQLKKSGQTATATGVNVVLSTKITCSFNLAGKAAGVWDVVVTNPDSQSGTLIPGFTINPMPFPTTTTLSPTGKKAGQGDFILTVNGTNFVEGSVVKWNSSNRTTTCVSATKLTAAIPASDIATAGTASITVFNPAPEGGTSTPALTFTVYNLAPTITTLSPTSKTAGGAGFTLTVNGTNFVKGSVVKWNGANRT